MATDVVFVYARPQVTNTALSANVLHSLRVLNAHGITATSATLDSIRAWGQWLSDLQPKVVVISAIIMPADDLAHLAKKFPRILFVNRIHSNLAWLFQVHSDMRDALRLMALAKSTPNVRYSLVCPHEAAAWSAAGVPVMSMPNVWTSGFADRPRERFTDPERLHLSAMFAVRLFKNPGGHVLTAATVNAYRPAVLHMQFDRADHPLFCEHAKQLANLVGLPLSSEPYRGHDDYFHWMESTVDVGLQISLTESFNYVALEHLSRGIPCVTSRCVEFSPWRVDPEDYQGAAAIVLDQILPDYAAQSARAIEAAKEIASLNESRFVSVFQDLLSRS